MRLSDHPASVNVPDRTSTLESKIARLAIVIIIAALIFAGAIFFIYAHKFSGQLDNEQAVWGQFGDYFGGTLNPIFSLLSLVAILVTLHVQSRELSISNKTLENQSDELKLQSFETSFFTFIRLNNENVRAINLEETEPDLFTGPRALRKLYQRLIDSYNFENKTNKIDIEDRIIKKSYDHFYLKNQRFIGHYLRTLQQMFIFINDRSPHGPEKYWEIIRAQMSTYELLLVFYHSATQADFMPLQDLIKMDFFNYLERDELIKPSLHNGILKKQEIISWPQAHPHK